LEDLVAHEDIIRIITNLIDSDNLPHLLLYGPPGSGKTSTIVAAAKRMYGKTYGSMTLELNASDARGIDVVRNEIKEFAGTQQLFNRGIKLIILDEADAMTQDAQNALRRIIEKYTKNARFCMICNYVSKIIPALQSRCTRFRFAPLLPSQILGRLDHVIQSENINITKEGKEAIMRLSGGDMRRVLNLLQSTAMSHNVNESTIEAGDSSTAMQSDETITENDVYLTSGAPLPRDIDQILDWLMNQSFTVAYENVTKLCSTKGYALVDVLQDLTTQLLLVQDLDNVALGSLLNGMSNVENRLAAGTDEKIQAASLVGVFVSTREATKSQ
jgi:replication factor C subunit 3/5